jgi:hypothetical protein
MSLGFSLSRNADGFSITFAGDDGERRVLVSGLRSASEAGSFLAGYLHSISGRRIAEERRERMTTQPKRIQ